MEIIIYTDGSTLNNQHKGGRRGGIGIYFGENDIRNKSIPLVETPTNKVTNQVSELTACIVAIETIIENNFNTDNTICIITDSKYTIDSITKWAKKWKTNDWKKSNGNIIENLELIKKLDSFYNIYNIKFKHVKAHMKEPIKSSILYKDWYGNMMADKYACDASKSV